MTLIFAIIITSPDIAMAISDKWNTNTATFNNFEVHVCWVFLTFSSILYGQELEFLTASRITKENEPISEIKTKEVKSLDDK